MATNKSMNMKSLPNNYSFLQEKQDVKQKVHFFNHLVLEEFELARATLLQIFDREPESAISLLEYILQTFSINPQDFKQENSEKKETLAPADAISDDSADDTTPSTIPSKSKKLKKKAQAPNLKPGKAGEQSKQQVTSKSQQQQKKIDNSEQTITKEKKNLVENDENNKNKENQQKETENAYQNFEFTESVIRKFVQKTPKLLWFCGILYESLWRRIVMDNEQLKKGFSLKKKKVFNYSVVQFELLLDFVEKHLLQPLHSQFQNGNFRVQEQLNLLRQAYLSNFISNNENTIILSSLDPKFLFKNQKNMNKDIIFNNSSHFFFKALFLICPEMTYEICSAMWRLKTKWDKHFLFQEKILDLTIEIAREFLENGDYLNAAFYIRFWKISRHPSKTSNETTMDIEQIFSALIQHVFMCSVKWRHKKKVEPTTEQKDEDDDEDEEEEEEEEEEGQEEENFFTDEEQIERIKKVTIESLLCFLKRNSKNVGYLGKNLLNIAMSNQVSRQNAMNPAKNVDNSKKINIPPTVSDFAEGNGIESNFPQPDDEALELENDISDVSPKKQQAEEEYLEEGEGLSIAKEALPQKPEKTEKQKEGEQLYLFKKFSDLEDFAISRLDFFDFFNSPQAIMPPTIVNENGKKKKNHFMQDFMNYVRAQKNDTHFLELVLKKALFHVQERKWKKLKLITSSTHFEILKPLIILLSWDSLNNEISSLQKLFSVMKFEYPLFKVDSKNNSFAGQIKSDFSLVTADKETVSSSGIMNYLVWKLLFNLNVSLWMSDQILELPTNINSKILRVKGLLTTEEMNDISEKNKGNENLITNMNNNLDQDKSMTMDEMNDPFYEKDSKFPLEPMGTPVHSSRWLNEDAMGDIFLSPQKSPDAGGLNSPTYGNDILLSSSLPSFSPIIRSIKSRTPHKPKAKRGKQPAKIVDEFEDDYGDDGEDEENQQDDHENYHMKYANAPGTSIPKTNNSDIVMRSQLKEQLPPEERIPRLILKELQNHSIVFIMLPWLPLIKENEIFTILERKPKIAQLERKNADKSKQLEKLPFIDHDILLLRSFYSLHEILRFVVKYTKLKNARKHLNLAPRVAAMDANNKVNQNALTYFHNNYLVSLEEKEEIRELMSNIETHLLRCESFPWHKLLILEKIFCLFFIREAHLFDVSKHSTQKGYFKFEQEEFILQKPLLEECICLLSREVKKIIEKLETEKEKPTSQLYFYKNLDLNSVLHRAKLFQQAVEDAEWRFHLSETIETFEFSITNSFLPYRNQTTNSHQHSNFLRFMLMHGNSFISNLLKNNQMEKCKAVIEQFEKSSNLELYYLQKKRKISFEINENLKKEIFTATHFLKILENPKLLLNAMSDDADFSSDELQNFPWNVCFDLLFCLGKNNFKNEADIKIVFSHLVKKTGQIFSKLYHAKPEKAAVFENFFRNLDLLLEKFGYKLTFQDILTLGIGSNGMMSMEDKKKTFSNILKLLSYSDRSVLEQKTVSELKEIIKDSINMKDSKKIGYLGQFLSHLLDFSEIFFEKKNYSLQDVLSVRPKTLLAELIFKDKQFDTAYSLAKLTGINLFSLVVENALRDHLLMNKKLFSLTNLRGTAGLTSFFQVQNRFSYNKTPTKTNFPAESELSQKNLLSTPNMATLSLPGSISTSSAVAESLHQISMLLTSYETAETTGGVRPKDTKDKPSNLQVGEFKINLDILKYMSQTRYWLIGAIAGLVLRKRDELQGDMIEFCLNTLKDSNSLVAWCEQRVELLKDFVEVFQKLDKDEQSGNKKPSNADESEDGKFPFRLLKEFNMTGEKADILAKINILSSLNSSSSYGADAEPAQEKSRKGSQRSSMYNPYSVDKSPTPMSQNPIQNAQIQKRWISEKMNEIEEDDEFYSSMITRFLNKGDVQNALFYADKGITRPLPDNLFQMYIEKSSTENHKSNTFKLIPRFNDKQVAASMVFKYINCWEIDTCIDLLKMVVSWFGVPLADEFPLDSKMFDVKRNIPSSSSISNKQQNPENSPAIDASKQGTDVGNSSQSPISNTASLSSKAADRLKELFLFKKILFSQCKTYYKTWTEINDLAITNPSKLVGDLLKENEFNLAKQVAQLFDPNNITLRMHIEQEHILSLFLKTPHWQDASTEIKCIVLSLEEHALKVSEFIIHHPQTTMKQKRFMCKLINHQSKHKFLNLAPKRETTFAAMEIGLTILCLLEDHVHNQLLHAQSRQTNAELEDEKKQEEEIFEKMKQDFEQKMKQFETLITKPKLIIESLLFDPRDIPIVKKIFQAIPELIDDDMLIFYGRKALELSSFVTPRFEHFSLDSSTDSIFEQKYESSSETTFPVLYVDNEMKNKSIRKNFSYPQAPSIVLAKSLFELCKRPGYVAQKLLLMCDHLSTQLQSFHIEFEIAFEKHISTSQSSTNNQDGASLNIVTDYFAHNEQAQAKQNENSGIIEEKRSKLNNLIFNKRMTIIPLIEQIIQYAKILFSKDPHPDLDDERALSHCDDLASHIELMKLIYFKLADLNFNLQLYTASSQVSSSQFSTTPTTSITPINFGNLQNSNTLAVPSPQNKSSIQIIPAVSQKNKKKTDSLPTNNSSGPTNSSLFFSFKPSKLATIFGGAAGDRNSGSSYNSDENANVGSMGAVVNEQDDDAVSFSSNESMSDNSESLSSRILAPGSEAAIPNPTTTSNPTKSSRATAVQNSYPTSSPFLISLNDLSKPETVRILRDKLIKVDEMELALHLSTVCNIEKDPVWIEWGLSLLKIGKYEQAEKKFNYLNWRKISMTRKKQILSAILNVLEGPTSEPEMYAIMKQRERASKVAQKNPEEEEKNNKNDKSRRNSVNASSFVKNLENMEINIEEDYYDHEKKNWKNELIDQYEERLHPPIFHKSPLFTHISKLRFDQGKKFMNICIETSPTQNIVVQKAETPNEQVAATKRFDNLTNYFSMKTEATNQNLSSFGSMRAVSPSADSINSPSSQNKADDTPSLGFVKANPFFKEMISFLVRNGAIQEAVQFIFENHLEETIFISVVLKFCLSHHMMKFFLKCVDEQDKRLTKLQITQQETLAASLTQNSTIAGSKTASPTNSSGNDKGSKNPVTLSYLVATCQYLSEKQMFELLYQVQVFMNDETRAGMTCMRLFKQSCNLTRMTSGSRGTSSQNSLFFNYYYNGGATPFQYSPSSNNPNTPNNINQINNDNNNANSWWNSILSRKSSKKSPAEDSNSLKKIQIEYLTKAKQHFLSGMNQVQNTKNSVLNSGDFAGYVSTINLQIDLLNEVPSEWLIKEETVVAPGNSKPGNDANQNSEQIVQIAQPQNQIQPDPENAEENPPAPNSQNQQVVTQQVVMTLFDKHRRYEICEILLFYKKTNLAFRIINQFQLEKVKIYSKTLINLTRSKLINNINELLTHVKENVNDREWDKIVFVIISVFVKEMNDLKNAYKFLNILKDKNEKIKACLLCKKFSAAFVEAKNSGNLQAVLMVREYVEKHQDGAKTRAILAQIDEWVSQVQVASAPPKKK